jgi:hypothetical protein
MKLDREVECSHGFDVNRVIQKYALSRIRRAT